MQIFVNWLCSCCILLNCFVLVYELIENVMSIYELFLNVCICIYMHVSLWFLSFSLVHYVYIHVLWSNASDDYAGWIVSDWMFKNKSFIEGRWTLKMQRNFACFFSMQVDRARINKHVMLEEELWMQWLWFYGSIINTACIVIIREMLQFNQ